MFAVLFAVGCAGTAATGGSDVATTRGDAVIPEATIQGDGPLLLGDPLAVAVDFNGVAFVADGSPGRVIAFNLVGATAQEFQSPRGVTGFYPTDVAVRGFFVFAVDEPSRRLLRFDNSGSYRDVLIDFANVVDGRRVSPYGLAVDESGRIAVTDVENHQVLLYDSFLDLEVSFGNYGSYTGQLDSPEGISFTHSGDLLVADTGNRRLQLYDYGGAFRRAVPASGSSNPFVHPRRAVLADDGRVFAADPEAGRVFVFDGDGKLQDAWVGPGPDFEPTDVELTRDGRLLVTDGAARALYVFKVM